ncbi:hypothetical protein MMC21_005658 [Puttea exsequens]|nr:hypothetical protein [Puttea exsequens]
MFELSRQVAVNARELIRDAVFYPDAMTQADRVRVFEILATLALPVGHSRFREVVDGLMDALKRISNASKRRSSSRFFDSAILCDSNEPAFRRTVKENDGVTPILDPRTGQQSWQYYSFVNSPPAWLPIGKRLCAEGLLGVAPLHGGGEHWMIICGATFTRQPTNFPKSDADRGQNFTALPYSQNHIDYWAQNRVAAMLHEMHHVLVPGSADVVLNSVTANGGDPLEAYQFRNTRTLATEVRNGRDYKVLYFNADTVNVIAVALWLDGAAWHRGLAREW